MHDLDRQPIFVHPSAILETKDVGNGTRIWAFVHVMPDVSIGHSCNIGDHSFIESGVTIGDEVTIKNGVSIWQGVTLGNKVFVGPNVAFTNDLRPRSRAFHEEPIKTEVYEGVSIGANATIVAGITLGAYSMIGAGCVVTKDVKAFELVFGNPARHRGWVDKEGNELVFENGKALRDGCCYELVDLKEVVIQTTD